MAMINPSEPHSLEHFFCIEGESPNEGALEDSFFFDRFLGFVERYDEVFKKQSLPSAEKWVSEKDYASIGHFLKPNVSEGFFSISYHELSFIPVEVLPYIHRSAKQIAPVLDEQEALYEELMQAYTYKQSESSSDSSFSYWLNRISRRHDDDLEE